MFPLRARLCRLNLLATFAAAQCVAFAPAETLAQQPSARADTTPLRADYRDLAELLQKLPDVAPPSLDERRALWLGALPLACLDRLQSRPGGRGAGRAGVTADTSAARGATADSAIGTGRGGARGGVASLAGAAGPIAAGANNGAGYFWVPTYSLVRDHDRLRAFWGCNDWHSAVASTWATVRLLETYPNDALHELAREKLNAHLGKANLEGEFSFFKATAAAINPIPSANQTGLFERPYGFAWLLELQSALRAWPDSQAKRWAANVAPLAKWMGDSLAAYVGALVEPVRAGTQNNTAQSMVLALDYADAASEPRLRASLSATARKLFLSDTACATQSERVLSVAGGRGGRGGAGGARGGRGAGRGANPADSAAAASTPNDLTPVSGGRGGAAALGVGAGGPEILSPCLTEAALMSTVLAPGAYLVWLDRFLPPMQSGRFAPLTEPIAIPTPPPVVPIVAGRGAAPDTSAAALAAAASAAATALATERARLAGLSFARAQAMERIAQALPSTDPRVVAWHRLSAIQADRGFELMRDDSAGLYWLPAQALLYESQRK